MRRAVRRLALSGETVRNLRTVELWRVSGGVVTVSEAGGGGPCPGEYSYVCKP